MIDTIQGVIAVIVAAIGALTTIYKLGFKKNRFRTKKYYKSLLRPFKIACENNSDINAIRFIKKNTKRDNDNIPAYIFYLVKIDDGERLKKVLLYDYYAYYPNDFNKMGGIRNNINKTIVYFLWIVAHIFLLYAATFAAVIFFFVILNVSGKINEIVNLIRMPFIFSLISLIFSFICLFAADFCDKDIYTLKGKKLEKIINEKIKLYEKGKNKGSII